MPLTTSTLRQELVSSRQFSRKWRAACLSKCGPPIAFAKRVEKINVGKNCRPRAPQLNDHKALPTYSYQNEDRRRIFSARTPPPSANDCSTQPPYQGLSNDILERWGEQRKVQKSHSFHPGVGYPPRWWQSVLFYTRSGYN